MAASKVPKTFMDVWRKFYWKQCYYYKYGLYHDDLYHMHTPLNQEAYRRLPQEVKDEVQWRQMRAFHVSMRKMYVAEEMWTDYDDDLVKGRYLQPYLEEVKREYSEQNAWNAK